MRHAQANSTPVLRAIMASYASSVTDVSPCCRSMSRNCPSDSGGGVLGGGGDLAAHRLAHQQHQRGAQLLARGRWLGQPLELDAPPAEVVFEHRRQPLGPGRDVPSDRLADPAIGQLAQATKLVVDSVRHASIIGGDTVNGTTPTLSTCALWNWLVSTDPT